MSNKSVITILGASGAQGGSVVKFLLADGTYRIRAVTRNTDSLKAKGPCSTLYALSQLNRQLNRITELISKGVEVVKADLDDVQSLTEAFKDAYGVFGLTNCMSLICCNLSPKSWTNQRTLRLLKQSGSIKTKRRKYNRARTSLMPQRKRVSSISSGLPSIVKRIHMFPTLVRKQPSMTTSKSQGFRTLRKHNFSYSLPCFPNQIDTRFYTSFYYENFINILPFKKDDKGNILADWPIVYTDGPISGYAVEDSGAYVVEAFKKPDEWLGGSFWI